MKVMKKKEIINELELMYALRIKAYEKLIDEEKYEEAQQAYNDSMETLKTIFEIKKLRASEIAKLAIDGTVGLGSLGVFTYLGVKSFKFEENGTFSSTGGKTISNESFRRLTPPKM